MISIIGTGKVGVGIAFLCASNGLDDILLINRTMAKAIGESLDIVNSIPATSQFSIHGTDDYSKLSGSKIVVISASVSIYLKNRVENLDLQVNMIRDIAKKIKQYCPSAIVLIVSNPLDVLTYFFHKESQLNRFKVIGIASSLDTSRFHHFLSEKFKVPLSSISNTLVLGEHGDTMVPIFSNILINDTPLLSMINEHEIDIMTNNVRNYWEVLRKYKSRSQFGIAKKTYDVIETIINSKELEIPAAVVLKGEYGEKDVSMGIPVKINSEGIIEIQKISINEKELVLLKKSSNQIRNNIKSVQIQV